MNLGMFKKKRKADEAFESEYEYVYGIVTTGEKISLIRFTICHGLVFHST